MNTMNAMNTMNTMNTMNAMNNAMNNTNNTNNANNANAMNNTTMVKLNPTTFHYLSQQNSYQLDDYIYQEGQQHPSEHYSCQTLFPQWPKKIWATQEGEFHKYLWILELPLGGRRYFVETWGSADVCIRYEIDFEEWAWYYRNYNWERLQ